ncbi:MAG: hypothetical protein L0207_03415 [Chlamydiae bacterium]|nr:hypothetical protein [Chlamydiota bacterium]
MNIIPPQISQSVRWFFTLEYPTRKNLPRFVAQGASLIVAALFIRHLIRNYDFYVTPFSYPIKVLAKKFFRVVSRIEVSQSEYGKYFSDVVDMTKIEVDLTKIKGIDMVGSKKIILENLNNGLKMDLYDYVEAYLAEKRFYISNVSEETKASHASRLPGQYEGYKNTFCECLKSQKNLSFVKLVVDSSNEEGIYIIIDFVEKEDMDRLKFTSVDDEKRKILKDPDDLLSKMENYYQISVKYEQVGEDVYFPTIPQESKWYTIFGRNRPQVKQYKKLFNEKVEKNKEALKEIVLYNVSDEKSRWAIHLCGFIKKDEEAIQILSERVHDQNEKIRIAVLHVFADKAEKNPEVEFPLSKILDSLKLPGVKDRIGATRVLYWILKNQKIKDDQLNEIITIAIPILLEMKKMKHPQSSEWAKKIFAVLNDQYSYAPKELVEEYYS